MKTIFRLRIVLFAFAIFGAFANFAQNDSGELIIRCCQFVIALTFLGELTYLHSLRISAGQRRAFNWFQLVLVYLTFIVLPFVAGVFNFNHDLFFNLAAIMLLGQCIVLFADGIVAFRRRRAGLPYVRGTFESFCLFLIFFSFFAKNMRWPGIGVVFPLAFLAAAVYYIIQAVEFVKQHYKKGRGITILLTIGTFSAIFMALSVSFKLMHLPGRLPLFIAACFFTILMIIGSLRWNYTYDGQRMNVFAGLKLFRSHIVPVYFAVFIYFLYLILQGNGLAPSFYTQRYPQIVFELSFRGKDAEAEKIAQVYNRFIWNAEKNGFIK
jgi:hypothetical protein